MFIVLKVLLDFRIDKTSSIFSSKKIKKQTSKQRWSRKTAAVSFYVRSYNYESLRYRSPARDKRGSAAGYNGKGQFLEGEVV